MGEVKGEGRGVGNSEVRSQEFGVVLASADKASILFIFSPVFTLYLLPFTHPPTQRPFKQATVPKSTSALVSMSSSNYRYGDSPQSAERHPTPGQSPCPSVWS